MTDAARRRCPPQRLCPLGWPLRMRAAWWLALLVLLALQLSLVASMSLSHRAELRARVSSMFVHGYSSYLRYAFPHDELKPLSRSFTDSLAELGNARRPASSAYQGVALTLIDSLSTLAVLGLRSDFLDAIDRVRHFVRFNVSVRVNVFEVNIRLLGGLLSAHVLATDRRLQLLDEGAYTDDVLLTLARDLGERLLPAFNTPTGIPYAWVNLQSGVEAGETREQCTAGVGTLLMEFGLLSYLTRNDSYYQRADRALTSLLAMRSPLGLYGNTLTIDKAQWTNHNAGIGAGVDSFFEYLLKSHIFFGHRKYLDAFEGAYAAVLRHLKHGAWYIEADMNSGQPAHLQFQSLHSFFPGLQSLLGHYGPAVESFAAFFSLWTRYQGLPERFILPAQQVHSSEKYYPLRPELMESAYYLYRESGDEAFLHAGEAMYWGLTNVSRVDGGYAAVKDVESHALEDHMSSFFLAETCKYLYLLFDQHNWLHSYSDTRQASLPKGEQAGEGEDVLDYIFTTEGHLFPLLAGMHRRYGDGGSVATSSSAAPPSPSTVAPTCPVVIRRHPRYHSSWMEAVASYQLGFSPLASPTPSPPQQCSADATPVVSPASPQPSLPFPLHLLPPGFTLPPGVVLQQLQSAIHELPNPSASHLPALHSSPAPLLPGQFAVRVGEGSFTVDRIGRSERLEVRNLGSLALEVVYTEGEAVHARVMTHMGVFGYEVTVERCGGVEEVSEQGELRIEAVGAYFGPSVPPGVAYTLGHSSDVEGVGEDMCEAKWDDSFDATAEVADEAAEDIADVAADDFEQAEDQPSSSTPPPASWVQRSVEEEVEIPLLSISAPLTVSESPLGCAPPASSPSAASPYAERVVLIQRGVCSFMDKVLLAEAAGAVGVLVINTQPTQSMQGAVGLEQAELFLMGFDGSDRLASVPSMMVSWRDGQRLQRCVEQARGEVTVHLERYEDLMVASVQAANGAGVRARRMAVTGSPSHLMVELTSGWTVDIEEKEKGRFQLNIH